MKHSRCLPNRTFTLPDFSRPLAVGRGSFYRPCGVSADAGVHTLLPKPQPEGLFGPRGLLQRHWLTRPLQQRLRQSGPQVVQVGRVLTSSGVRILSLKSSATLQKKKEKKKDFISITTTFLSFSFFISEHCSFHGFLQEFKAKRLRRDASQQLNNSCINSCRSFYREPFT